MGDQIGIAGHRRANAAQGLAEGDQAQRHIDRRETCSIDAAAPGFAEHADAMRIVDVQRGLLFARELREFAQGRDIAVHREHAVTGEQGCAFGMRGELARGAFGIAMRITLERTAGQARGIDQAGVVEPVLHAQVALAQQRLQHREVGHVAAAEQQRALALQPVGEVAFQRGVLRAMPADQVRGGAARAFAGRIAHCGDDAGMLRQAEVIVAAEIQEYPAVDFTAHAFAPRHRAQDAPALQGIALRARCQRARLQPFAHLRPLR